MPGHVSEQERAYVEERKEREFQSLLVRERERERAREREREIVQ